jgi:hypothetical protein
MTEPQFLLHVAGTERSGKETPSPVGPFPGQVEAWAYYEMLLRIRLAGEGSATVGPLHAPQPEGGEWTCERCGSHRWLGWRAGPAHEGFPRFAQCTPCGKVQALPAGEVER